jgi:hypothetical protein
MNVFTVTWEEDAEQELARIWATASDRAAITRAQSQIDALLMRGSFQYAVHLSEGLLTLTVHPLMVYFEVDQPRRVVEVSWVKFVP